MFSIWTLPNTRRSQNVFLWYVYTFWTFFEHFLNTLDVCRTLCVYKCCKSQGKKLIQQKPYGRTKQTWIHRSFSPYSWIWVLCWYMWGFCCCCCCFSFEGGGRWRLRAGPWPCVGAGAVLRSRRQSRDPAVAKVVVILNYYHLRMRILTKYLFLYSL